MADVPTTEKLSDLIGLLYDASLDARLWPVFLRNLSSAFGSDQGMILNVDSAAGPCEMLHTLNMDLSVMTKWQGSKEHVDLWYQGVQKTKRDTVSFVDRERQQS